MGMNIPCRYCAYKVAMGKWSGWPSWCKPDGAQNAYCKESVTLREMLLRLQAGLN